MISELSVQCGVTFQEGCSNVADFQPRKAHLTFSLSLTPLDCMGMIAGIVDHK